MTVNSFNLNGLIKFLSRDDWSLQFDEVMGDHFWPVMDEFGLDQQELGEVMLDVLDCGDAKRTERRVKLYNEYGFQHLPTNAMRTFIPIATIKKMLD